MQGGMRLLAATSMGPTRTVIVVTDGDNLSWGIPNSKPVMSVSLSNIAKVRAGMPPKIQKSFLQSDIDRSFNLVLKGDSKAVTFLAPTSLERNALVQGFQSLLARTGADEEIEDSISTIDIGSCSGTRIDESDCTAKLYDEKGGDIYESSSIHPPRPPSETKEE